MARANTNARNFFITFYSFLIDVARLVEISLREMDRGVIEAAQAMGCFLIGIY